MFSSSATEHPPAMPAFGGGRVVGSLNDATASTFGAPSKPTSHAMTPSVLPVPSAQKGPEPGESGAHTTTTTPFSSAQGVPDPRLSLSRNVESTSGSIIACRVGTPHTTFFVHRAVLYKSSEFLKTHAELESNDIDSESSISLPDFNSEAFALYSKWLYSSAIISIPEDETPKDDAEWRVLASAYALGEKLIDIDFKNTVIDALRAKVKSKIGNTVWKVAPELVRIIYAGDSKDSPARRFVVDLYHGHGGASNLDDRSLPSDFLFDLARVGLVRTIKRHVSSERCEHHEHGKDKACYIDRKA
ncbi:hypothetical protein M409DRAFT_55127 [Zasmidium cellare ATCC 36951]|uniref:BTB domain-containing protein n=1 Tax=Zasmidium cellare ATCC 36951 TaxID=1080233 RepID=A0A6A6CGG2_ZASCE|nr:uncharacterized protein M409DRAFT_55127 [Zasmidium cellare ATCC 36951]KAF2166274.1 hypothetical protein M409DRAFT_55127 [Zasmidium cellare ATCC 36951]